MSSIAKFYSGRSVFITGGSGFIGKQIVEKLLRSCPDVESIYLLIRPKKGTGIDQRLQQTVASPVSIAAQRGRFSLMTEGRGVGGGGE